MKIAENKHVTVIYDLNVGEGEERELMERATIEEPLEFIFGTNTMLEAFEQQIEGFSQGDNFSFSLTPEEAYGDYDDARVVELPKNIFEVEGKIDDEMLVEGNTLPMMDTSGNRLMGSIVSVGDEAVIMDFNHPLAGETLHFEGTVTGLRDATAEEIAALFSGGGCGAEGCGCNPGGCGNGEESACGSGCGTGDCNC